MNNARTLACAEPAIDPIDASLSGYASANLELLGRRELLCRIDSKFVVSASRLDQILGGLADHYAVLRVPTGNIATYKSLYFDTPSLRCFHDHRRGRRIRHKVRIRHYPDRQVSFLEVKTKRNETVTDKHRLPIPYQNDHLGSREREFLRGHVGGMVEELRPQLWINYRRISLIGLHTAERVTIDIDLTVSGHDAVASWFGQVNVVEVKQAPFCVRTPVMRALLGSGMRERSLSKYVVAVALSRPEQRRNRLMPDLRALERT